MPLGASSLVLAALALQNSAHVLLVSYTRQRTVPLYFVSVIIALGEALKLAINGLLLCMLEPDLAASLRELRGLSRRQILAYAVPALLYTIGSNVRQPYRGAEARAAQRAARACLCAATFHSFTRSAAALLSTFGLAS
jgi:hypothetical protein